MLPQMKELASLIIMVFTAHPYRFTFSKPIPAMFIIQALTCQDLTDIDTLQRQLKSLNPLPYNSLGILLVAHVSRDKHCLIPSKYCTVQCLLGVQINCINPKHSVEWSSVVVGNEHHTSKVIGHISPEVRSDSIPAFINHTNDSRLTVVLSSPIISILFGFRARCRQIQLENQEWLFLPKAPRGGRFGRVKGSRLGLYCLGSTSYHPPCNNLTSGATTDPSIGQYVQLSKLFKFYKVDIESTLTTNSQ